MARSKSHELINGFVHTPSFWYLCGASEDAYLGVDKGKGNYEFDLDSASLSWLQAIHPILLELINKDVTIRPHTNRAHHRIRFWHKQLVLELQRVKANPRLVLAINHELQRHYIAGFFDAEGTATITGSKQPSLSIYSTNVEKLELLSGLLNQESITSGIYHPQTRNVRQLYITGRGSVKQFASIMPLRHPAKRQKVHEIQQ